MHNFAIRFLVPVLLSTYIFALHIYILHIVAVFTYSERTDATKREKKSNKQVVDMRDVLLLLQSNSGFQHYRAHAEYLPIIDFV